MSKIVKAFKLLYDKKYRFLFLASRGFYNKMDDEKYLKKRFKVKFDKDLDLRNPKTFNEKLQWLKLNDRKPIYTKMVDKYEAKNLVASIIGEKYIIKTIGIYDSFDQIDFESLPNRFVMKCTHDSGGMVICTDKSTFNYRKAKKKINHFLKRKYFYEHREWPYKNVPPRILIEEYMSNENGEPLMDYKFYCFNGEGPRFLYISKGLENHSTASISFVNLDWTFAPYERADYKPFENLPKKPERFEEMISIAKKLSQNTSFLRVDLYQINGKVYFSELTFTPCSGCMPFKDEKYDLEIGEMLKLPYEL